MTHNVLRKLLVFLIIGTFFGACGGTTDTTPANGFDMGVVYPDGAPNTDAYFADDPPPKYCGEFDAGAPMPPGGTAECPDDKNREGCPCKAVGKTTACWPGLRANRNRGICKDGQTSCLVEGEVTAVWGPCEGYVFPKPGATEGKEACKCFSEGNWKLENLSPCILTYKEKGVFAVSSHWENGDANCPVLKETDEPRPKPNTNWSINELKVDCAGRFELCYTIKAGEFNAPKPTDCTVVQTCTKGWYSTPDQSQPLPPLPSWYTDKNTEACVKKFRDEGGYGEMSVVGLSIQCEPIGSDTGGPVVFKRKSYCPTHCDPKDENPTNPACMGCKNDGDGTF